MNALDLLGLRSTVTVVVGDDVDPFVAELTRRARRCCVPVVRSVTEPTYWPSESVVTWLEVVQVPFLPSTWSRIVLPELAGVT